MLQVITEHEYCNRILRNQVMAWTAQILESWALTNHKAGGIEQLPHHLRKDAGGKLKKSWCEY